MSLVRDFAATGGKRVVAAGSCAEYDWSYEVLREDTPLNASSPYGRAKARTGQLLCETMPEQGLSLAWARIFFCYGPGEPRGRLVGDLVRAVTNGEPVDCTDGLQVRDYMHTADVANALVTVLMSDLIGPVNIASGKGTAVGDIIDQLGQLSGQAELFRIGARARPADDPPRLVGDASKLKSLGFLPEFDLARGLRDCLKRVDGAIQ